MSSPTVHSGFSDANPDPSVRVDANEIAPCGPIDNKNHSEGAALQEDWMVDVNMDESAILGEVVWTLDTFPS